MILGPLPEIFYKVALNIIMKQVNGPHSAKALLHSECLKLHAENATSQQAVKRLRVITQGNACSWPSGIKHLRSERSPIDPETLISLFYNWQSFYAHRLYRGAQIRALLSEKRGHLIRVFVDEEVAPCGCKNGDTLLPSPDVLKQMPPCERLNCCCNWALMTPPRAR